MALTTTVHSKSPSQTPYQLDPEQTLKASKALLEHVRKEAKRIQESSSKKALLKNEDSDSDVEHTSGDEIPIWLNLTTKQHIVDRGRLKPSKIPVPHSLNGSDSLSICIIAADPQRSLKNVTADPTFPSALSSRITKVIGLTKLKDRYKSFEQRRALLAEHDIFLADDRIISRLPAVLGKVFYKGTSKRPIPISIAQQERVDGKRVKAAPETKKSRDQGSGLLAQPITVAKEIEKALSSVAISLRPGTNVAIRVGLATFAPQQLMDNIVVIIPRLIEKHVVKGWKNVKAIHIKSPDSMAVPVWLADELWAEEDNVDAMVDVEDATSIEADNLKRKRNPATTKGPQAGSRKKQKIEEVQNQKQVQDRESDVLRKKKLRQQKHQAFNGSPIAV